MIIAARPPGLPRRSMTMPSAERNWSIAFWKAASTAVIQTLNADDAGAGAAGVVTLRSIDTRTNIVGRLPTVTGSPRLGPRGRRILVTTAPVRRRRLIGDRSVRRTTQPGLAARHACSWASAAASPRRCCRAAARRASRRCSGRSSRDARPRRPAPLGIDRRHDQVTIDQPHVEARLALRGSSMSVACRASRESRRSARARGDRACRRAQRAARRASGRRHRLRAQLAADLVPLRRIECRIEVACRGRSSRQCRRSRRPP